MINNLFRGKTEDVRDWDVEKNEEMIIPGKWIVGSLIAGIDSYDVFIIPPHFVSHMTKGDMRDMSELYNFCVVPETVGQYTGFDDKNGNKIFEGNIVNVKSEMEFRNGSTFWYENKKGSVEMSGGHWAINIEGSFLFLGNSGQFLEIIGNIHDNPELLEV